MTSKRISSQEEAANDAMIEKYGSVEILAPEYKKLTNFVRLVSEMHEYPIPNADPDDAENTMNDLIGMARGLLKPKQTTTTKGKTK